MTLRVLLISAAIFGLAMILAPLQLLFIRLGSRGAARLPQIYHRIALRLIGVKLKIVGEPVTDRSVLFVSNHISWLDIPIYGAALPVSFIAKREVGDWGAFGTLARLQRTVFIDRERRARVGAQNAEIAGRLDAGDSLVLFAEGTSTDGAMVLPFKSALFAVAERNQGSVTVQPVTIAYRSINGVPITRATRPVIGWYGDMDLGPHFLKIMGLGKITAELHFHPPVENGSFATRKDLANYCYDRVREGLLAARRGHRVTPLPTGPQAGSPEALPATRSPSTV